MGISTTGDFVVSNGTTGTGTFFTFTQGVATSGVPKGILYTAAAHNGVNTGTEIADIDFDLSATVAVAGSTTLANNRSFRIRNRTFTAASATTWTKASTLVIDGPPLGGGAGPLTITNPFSVEIVAGNSKTFGKWIYDATDITTGTTGAQTISKPSGSVNFAAAATTLVVTNTLVTTSSHVIAWVETADTTAKSCSTQVASGSFTITLNAAATAETRVGFLVIN